MHAPLKAIWPGGSIGGRAASAADSATTTKKSVMPLAPRKRLQGMRVAVLYKAHVEADAAVLDRLQRELCALGCDVFYDQHLAVGVEWAREIETRIRGADAAIVLLSPNSVQSEMIAYEVEIAHESVQQSGRPRLMPVRLQLNTPLPSALAAILDPLQYFLWQGQIGRA